MAQTVRIAGLDLARALAVFIMVLVNFRAVLATDTKQGWLPVVLDALQGKGAALFVVLAGVGMSMMLKSALTTGDLKTIRHRKTVLLKRAAFLFIFGLLLMPFWRADILHYYGLFISVGALLVTSRSAWLWLISATLIVTYPMLLSVIDYDTGWDWETFQYSGFWTTTGFVRNLFINGFHPVVPWLAFVLAGIWFGRLDLAHRSTQLRILLTAGSVYVLIKAISWMLLSEALGEEWLPAEEALAVFGTQPMPPLPLYMISATSMAFFIIVLCICVTRIFAGGRWTITLINTGQMALTLYVGHALPGLFLPSLYFGERQLELTTVFCYSLVFYLACVWFSWQWCKRYSKDPVSMFMRHIAG